MRFSTKHIKPNAPFIDEVKLMKAFGLVANLTQLFVYPITQTINIKLYLPQHLVYSKRLQFILSIFIH